VRLPIAGGGYFRFYPYAVLRALLRKLEGEGSPLVMYMHPWEFDPDQPRMEGSMVSRLRHYLNLDKTEGRMRALLQDFSFAPIRRVFPQIEQMQDNLIIPPITRNASMHACTSSASLN
jgi:hypothetical protein